MKKVFSLLLAFAMLLSLCACGGNSSKSKFDTPVEINGFELTASSEIVDANEVNAEQDQFKEFLTTDLTNSGSVARCDVTFMARDGYSIVVVPFTIKNLGDTEKEFTERIALSYNKDTEYEVTEFYWIADENDVWHKDSSIKVAPMSTLTFKAKFNIPKEVMDDTDSSLKLIVADKTFKIR